MNLPEHLKKKRDALADRSVASGRNLLELHEADARVRHFKYGFTAACAELLPMIEKILEYCEPNTDKMWAASIVAEILKCDFRDAAKELNKWRES